MTRESYNQTVRAGGLMRLSYSCQRSSAPGFSIPIERRSCSKVGEPVSKTGWGGSIPSASASLNGGFTRLCGGYEVEVAQPTEQWGRHNHMAGCERNRAQGFPWLGSAGMPFDSVVRGLSVKQPANETGSGGSISAGRATTAFAGLLHRKLQPCPPELCINLPESLNGFRCYDTLGLIHKSLDMEREDRFMVFNRKEGGAYVVGGTHNLNSASITDCKHFSIRGGGTGRGRHAFHNTH